MPVSVAQFLSISTVNNNFGDEFEPHVLLRMKEEIKKSFRVVFDFMSDLYTHPMLSVQFLKHKGIQKTVLEMTEKLVQNSHLFKIEAVKQHETFMGNPNASIISSLKRYISHEPRTLVDYDVYLIFKDPDKRNLDPEEKYVDKPKINKIL